MAHVRDLRGVVEREKAAIGVLLTMHRAYQAHAHGSGHVDTQKIIRIREESGSYYPSLFPCVIEQIPMCECQPWRGMAR